MPVTITSKGVGLDASRKDLEEFADNGALAGLFGEELATRGLRVEVGFKHRTAGRVQARPFLSVAADIVEPRVWRGLEHGVGKVADGGKAADATLLEAAELVVDTVETVITSNMSGGPELAQSTRDRKGHGIRGLDSGEMVEGLDAKLGRPES